MRVGQWAAVILLMAACGSGEGDNGDDACGEDEVQVSYLGTSNDRMECAPIPTQCGGTASCADQDCIAAMYALCEAPAVGVGCSDTFPPVIISCNE